MSQEMSHVTLITDETEQQKKLNLASEDMLKADYPWVLKNTVDSINVYSNNEASVLLNVDNVQKEVQSMKDEMETRNTWIWDFLSKIGILTAIWAQTDRFGTFWKGPMIQQYLFQNKEPKYIEIWGPHQSPDSYQHYDQYQGDLDFHNEFAQIKVLYLLSWVPTFHQQVFNQACQRFARGVYKWYTDRNLNSEKETTEGDIYTVKAISQIKAGKQDLLNALTKPQLRKQWEYGGPVEIKNDSNGYDVIIENGTLVKSIKLSYFIKDGETFVIEEGKAVTSTPNEKNPDEPTITEENIDNIYILKKNSVSLIFDTTKKLGGDSQIEGLKAMLNVMLINQE